MRSLRRGTLLALAVAFAVHASAESEEHHRSLRRAAYAACELKQWSRGLELFRAAAALPERSGDDLRGIYVATANLGDKRGSIVALTAVLRFDVAAIREQDVGAVLQTFQKARELVPGDSARFDLLDAAFTSGYRNNLGEVPGPDWIDLADLLLLRGDTTKAARVIDEIDLPSDLIDVRADKRFAALVDAQPARYDVEAAARRRVERLRALSARKPRSLEVLVALATATKDLGKPDAALALLDRALARAAAPDAFDDQEQRIMWLHDERSRALWRLARRDEAIVELQRGMAIPENRLPNISQRVNLAQRYAYMNRPEMALKTLDRPDEDATPYGKMAWQFGRLAAADELGDEPLAQEVLDYMRAHEPDAPRILRDGFVLSGMLDDAARIFIGELDDPMFRTSALHALQKFDSVPGVLSPERWETYWKQLKARPDVKAAVAKYGRVQSYALPPQ
jgi:tetratricopeptide (TPR) repeat protein